MRLDNLFSSASIEGLLLMSKESAKVTGHAGALKCRISHQLGHDDVGGPALTSRAVAVTCVTHDVLKSLFSATPSHPALSSQYSNQIFSASFFSFV
jgi:hypothetical protein